VHSLGAVFLAALNRPIHDANSITDVQFLSIQLNLILSTCPPAQDTRMCRPIDSDGPLQVSSEEEALLAETTARSWIDETRDDFASVTIGVTNTNCPLAWAINRDASTNQLCRSTASNGAGQGIYAGISIRKAIDVWIDRATLFV
jgi:hypothetical protein